jgi:hypothetical protein
MNLVEFLSAILGDGLDAEKDGTCNGFAEDFPPEEDYDDQ